jgi:uncharacterized membrane protein
LGNPGIMVIMASVVILISIITFISALITASDYSYTDLAGSMVVISIFMFVMTLMAICCMVAVVGYLARISKALDKNKDR